MVGQREAEHLPVRRVEAGDRPARQHEMQELASVEQVGVAPVPVVDEPRVRPAGAGDRPHRHVAGDRCELFLCGLVEGEVFGGRPVEDSLGHGHPAPGVRDRLDGEHPPPGWEAALPAEFDEATTASAPRAGDGPPRRGRGLHARSVPAPAGDRLSLHVMEQDVAARGAHDPCSVPRSAQEMRGVGVELHAAGEALDHLDPQVVEGDAVLVTDASAVVAAEPFPHGTPHLTQRGRRVRESPSPQLKSRDGAGDGIDVDPGDARAQALRLVEDRAATDEGVQDVDAGQGQASRAIKAGPKVPTGRRRGGDKERPHRSAKPPRKPPVGQVRRPRPARLPVRERGELADRDVTDVE
ncbi:MAG: hypothetical protein ACRDZO_14745 [Egibacteraceae bacterium]